jgi:hypothetical protein
VLEASPVTAKISSAWDLTKRSILSSLVTGILGMSEHDEKNTHNRLNPEARNHLVVKDAPLWAAADFLFPSIA